MIYKEINYTINFKTAWSQLLQGEQYGETSGGLKLLWRVSGVPSGVPWLLKVRWRESQTQRVIRKQTKKPIVCHRRLYDDLLDALNIISPDRIPTVAAQSQIKLVQGFNNLRMQISEGLGSGSKIPLKLGGEVKTKGEIKVGFVFPNSVCSESFWLPL